jgi:hypothetical protein
MRVWQEEAMSVARVTEIAVNMKVTFILAE